MSDEKSTPRGENVVQNEGYGPGYGYGYGYGYGAPPDAYGYGHNGYTYGYGQNYGYGGGKYGYGYGGGYGNQEKNENGETPTLTIRDYLLMIRERFWYLLLAIFICTTSSLVYTANKTDEFMAGTKLRLYRQAPTAKIVSQTSDTESVYSGDDLGTQLEMMRSNSIIQRVAKSLSPEMRAKVMEPYQAGNIFTGPLREEDILENCRSIRQQNGTLIVIVNYVHPIREVALLMSERFAEQIREANEEKRLQVMVPLLEVSRMKVQSIEKELEEFQKKKDAMLNNNPKLFEIDAQNLLMGDLQQRRATVMNEERAFKETDRLMKQLEELRARKDKLTKLPVIANAGNVSRYDSVLRDHEIQLKIAKLTYGPKHQIVVDLEKRIEETNVQLNLAINEEIEKFTERFQTMKNSLELARAALDEKQKEMLALSEDRNKLNELNRAINDRTRNRDNMEAALNAEEIRLQGGLLPAIDMIDRSFLIQQKPINKNYSRHAVIGVFTGTAIGLAIIFMLAFFDDRVKSAADIEGYLRLPLLGVLPVARRSSSAKKARLVEDNKDRPIVEAFRSVYSSLRLNKTARKAKLLLVTSTSPSEGKSFVATNLALTYAQQGERVLIIDADLRLPVIGKTLGIQDDLGITRYLQGEIALEDAIHYNVARNMDVLAVGASCSNPTQLLVNKKFTEMIMTLKTCYDRVILDSPPIGAVSDALNLLHFADGVIYVVRFNTVKKRVIRSNVARLLESETPILGAVINYIGIKVIQYYTNGGDRAYLRYYTKQAGGAVNVNVE
jgi:capsular exopolysaccharide synthesis family protein